MNELYYDKIDAYHLGQLPAAESKDFEAALAKDPALAAALQSRRVEWEAQELLAEQQLRAQIRQAFAESSPPPQSSAGQVIPWKWILSSALLLLLAGGIFFWLKTPPAPMATPPVNAPAPTQTPTPVQEDKKEEKAVPPPPIAQAPKPPSVRQIAMAAYRTPDGLTQTRGDAGDTLALAFTAFSQKKYRQVVQLLAILPENDQQEALSLRAHANFGAGRFVAASQDFNDLVKGGIYRREAEWFGVLAAMASSGADKNTWMATLQRIRSTANHPYQADAEVLGKKLGQ
jgi:hypothetical protein